MAVKVKHVNRNRISDLDRILNSFIEAVKSEGRTYAMNGGRLDFSRSFDDLLVARKALWEKARDGMAKRQDLEAEIGLFSAIVWWNRRALERKFNIRVSEDELLKQEEARKEERDAWNSLRETPEKVVE